MAKNTLQRWTLLTLHPYQQPILMVNGRSDTAFTVDSSHIPLYEALGTPEDDKRHVILEVGHGENNQDLIRWTVEWLDRYLGTVSIR